jgi:hypothetical protein
MPTVGVALALTTVIKVRVSTIVRAPDIDCARHSSERCQQRAIDPNLLSGASSFPEHQHKNSILILLSFFLKKSHLKKAESNLERDCSATQSTSAKDLGLRNTGR